VAQEIELFFNHNKMSNLLNQAYNPEFFRKNGHELVDIIAGYLQDCKLRKNMPVLPWKEPNEFVKELKNDFENSD